MQNKSSFDEAIKDIIGSTIESPSLSFERNLLSKINERKINNTEGERFILIAFFGLMMIILSLLFGFNLVESGSISDWISMADSLLKELSLSSTFLYSASCLALFLMIQLIILNKKIMGN